MAAPGREMSLSWCSWSSRSAACCSVARSWARVASSSAARLSTVGPEPDTAAAAGGGSPAGAGAGGVVGSSGMAKRVPKNGGTQQVILGHFASWVGILPFPFGHHQWVVLTRHSPFFLSRTPRGWRRKKMTVRHKFSRHKHLQSRHKHRKKGVKNPFFLPFFESPYSAARSSWKERLFPDNLAGQQKTPAWGGRGGRWGVRGGQATPVSLPLPVVRIRAANFVSAL